MNTPQTTTEKYFIVLTEIYRESKKRYKRPMTTILRSLRTSSTILPALISQGYLKPAKGRGGSDWKWLTIEPTIEDAELIRVKCNNMVNGERNKTPFTRRTKFARHPIPPSEAIETPKPITPHPVLLPAPTNHPTPQRVSILWGLFTWERK